MDFGLKEIGITFMVGAFTILGFELVLFYLFNLDLTGFYREQLGLAKGTKRSRRRGVKQIQDNSHQPMRLAVFIGLSFGIGILAEDLSNKYLDNAKSPVKLIPTIINFWVSDNTKNTLGLPSLNDSRVEILIGDWQNPKIRPLAKELAENQAFEILDKKNGVAVQEWLLLDKPDQLCKKSDKECVLENGKVYYEDVENSIIKLYFYAKNRTYKETNYYDEMKKIQARWDFSRSIALISFIYFLFVFVGFPIALFISGIKMKNRKNHDLQRFRLKKLYSAVTEFFILNKNKIRNTVITFIILITINFFALWAYQRETDEFNKRAFGYFSSLLTAEKLNNRNLDNNKNQSDSRKEIIRQNVENQ